MDLLARQDPKLDQIIFYDDVQLFEDELHDNGESVMNVRVVSFSWPHRSKIIRLMYHHLASGSCLIHSSFFHVSSFVWIMFSSEHMM